MRITLDSNIFVNALIRQNTPPALIYRAWRQRKFTLVSSEFQLSELNRVFRYRKLRKYINSLQAEFMIESIRYESIIIEDAPEINISPDKDDNHILAAALAGDCRYLITGDRKDLLSLGGVENTRIITAREAMQILLN